MKMKAGTLGEITFTISMIVWSIVLLILLVKYQYIVTDLHRKLYWGCAICTGIFLSKQSKGNIIGTIMCSAFWPMTLTSLLMMFSLKKSNLIEII